MAAFAASLSSSTSWIAEDDLLLKNAVEAGASLEALAKGAVRFSRKFTIRELQERWNSLLYDPVISAEASARMLEFERSASNNLLKSMGPGVSVDNAEVTPKRKVESVRGVYHALRKRTCIRPVNTSNLSFIGPPHLSDRFGCGTGSLEHGKRQNETPVGSSMLGVCTQNHYGLQDMDLGFLHHEPHDNNLIKEPIEYDIFEQENVREDSGHILRKTLVDFGTSQTVEGMGASCALPQRGASYHSLEYSSPQPRTPLWKTIEDMSAPAMPVSLSHRDRAQGSEETFILPDDMGENTINSSALPETDLAHLSDSLLNFGNENELGFTDADREDTTNKSCHENIDPIVLSSPNGFKEDDVLDVKEPQKSLPSSHAVLKDIDNQSRLSQGNEPSIYSSEVSEPSSSSMSKPQSRQLLDKERICTFNTEDREIPCNDDFVPCKGATTSALQTSYKRSCDPASSFLANRKESGQKLSTLWKEDNPAQSFPGSMMGGSVMFGGITHEHPVFSSGVNTKSHDLYHLAGISRQANSAHVDPSQGRSSFATLNSLTHEGLKEKLLHASFGTDCPSHTISSSTSDTFPRPESNPSAADPEASLDQDISESDDDIPNFSDIESMILDMDLCPDDPDLHLSREMSRYQHEDTKRTIIRLEQCAQSSMHRAIAYQGALAVFYGRYMKHYIKKTEVILGRATDEVNVDIDLGREGRANKISRRQAIIKMESDGSFILKNLGKSSVFVNGKEIATGQGLILRSGNLIEIRDMAFVFEINQNSVRRYLENVAKTDRGKNAEFQWSEERLPGSMS